MAATSTYQPFGEKRTDSAGIIATETKGFIGERYDSSPELQYLNARYYDPLSVSSPLPTGCRSPPRGWGQIATPMPGIVPSI